MKKVDVKLLYDESTGLLDFEKILSTRDAVVTFEYGKVPFLNPNLANNFVSSFGFTYRTTKDDFDWYYKGNGKSLVTNDQTLILPKFGIWAGFEIELCTVHVIDRALKPQYLGYTLAVDFTATGMRRKYENLKNLSHLFQSAISNKVILASYPEKGTVSASLVRKKQTIWKKESKVGQSVLKYELSELEDKIFRNTNLFQPNDVIYTLTGAAINSSNEGIMLEDGDLLVSEIPSSGISLRNKYMKQ